MTRSASHIAVVIGVRLLLLAAIPAQAGPTGCIYVYRSARQSYSCPTQTGCGNGCSFGQYYYDYPWQRLDCATLYPTTSCSGTAENDAYAAWMNANVPPAGAAHC